MSELTRQGLWTEDIRLSILQHHGKHPIPIVEQTFSLRSGSIQRIPDIPDDIKATFLTAWEIDPLTIVDMAADRGPFIDQTQSMSLNVPSPNPEQLVRCTPHLADSTAHSTILALPTAACVDTWTEDRTVLLADPRSRLSIGIRR